MGGTAAIQPIRFADDNWWRPLVSSDAATRTGTATTVGDAFEVMASMTAGQAYSLLPYVVEASNDDDLRFMTTGLIDPGVSHWGFKTCRYLGNKLLRPTVATSDLPADLAGRLKRVRRPKVLVAGLSTKVEAFFDVQGDHVGAVSTYSLMHPSDDRDALADLCGHLNSAESASRLQQELGATALGGGRITLTKLFLRGLPWKS